MTRARIAIYWIGVVVIVIVVAIQTACLKQAEEHRQASNGNFDVQLLFTVDGVRVYRFVDGHAHYFAVADRGNAAAFNTESCGKNCTREVEIQTVRR